MKKLILVLLPVLVLLVGCNKEKAYTYSGIEAGTLSGGVFTSDSGTQMTVVGNEHHFDISSTRRVVISYETRPITGTGPIEIDLQNLLDAGILQAVHARSLPADPTGSPVQVNDAWFSEDYLNILATFEGKDADKHAFEAAFTVDEKELTFRLDHDGSQDAVTGGTTLSIFLCIPMYDPTVSFEQYSQAQALKPAYPVPVVLQWTGRTLEGGPLTLFERKGNYAPRRDN